MTNILHRLHTAATISFSSLSTSFTGTNEVTVLQWLPKLDWLERLSLGSRLLGGELIRCLGWPLANFFRAWLLHSWCSSDCTTRRLAFHLLGKRRSRSRMRKVTCMVDAGGRSCRATSTSSSCGHFLFLGDKLSGLCSILVSGGEKKL